MKFPSKKKIAYLLKLFLKIENIILSSAFFYSDGSGGTRSYEFAKKLISNGHTVTIVCGSYWLAKSGLNNKFENGVRKGVVDKINVIEFDLSYSNSDSFLRDH